LFGSRDALFEWHSRNLLILDSVAGAWEKFVNFMSNNVFRPLANGLQRLQELTGLSFTPPEGQKFEDVTSITTGALDSFLEGGLLSDKRISFEELTGLDVGLEFLNERGFDAGLELTSGISDGVAEGAEREDYNALMEPYRQRVQEAVSNVTIFGNETGLDISQGIIAGMLATSTAEIDTAAEELTDEIVKSLEAATESESPSELTAREIGEPLAEGIFEGMLRFAAGASVDDLINGIVNQLRSLKGKAGAQLTAFNNVLVSRNAKVQKTLVTNVAKTNDAVLEEFGEFTSGLSGQFEELFNTIVSQTSGLSFSIQLEFGAMFTTLSTFVTTFGNEFVGIWSQITELSLPQIGGMTTSIVGALTQGNESMFGRLTSLFVGTEGSGGLGENLGLGLLGGIARGISDPNAISTILGPAIDFLVATVQNLAEEKFMIVNPSLLMAEEVGMPISEGVALGIEQGSGSIANAMNTAVNAALFSTLDSRFGANPNAVGPSSVSNVSRTNNFNLNVTSSQRSQGVINDFSILRVMAFDE
jgi:hypothetical protein